MWKIIKRFLWLIIIIIIAAVGIPLWLSLQKEKNKPRFETETLERGTIISTVNTTGIVQAVISVEIGSQVSGKILKLYVDFNSPVKKGQMLAQIDPAMIQAQAGESSANLESARATLINFQAQYESAVTKVRAAQATVKSSEAQIEISRAALSGSLNAEQSAKANVKKAEAQLENSRVEFKRSEELMKKDFISHTEMDAADTKYKVSLADLDVARSALQQASSSVRSSQLQLDSARYSLESSKVQEDSQRALARSAQAQIQQSRAQVNQASERLKQAQVNLGYTNIFSPIDGVVVSRAVDVGQTVAAAFQAPKLFQIAKDLKDMEVLASVDEADIGKVKEGMESTFTVDAYQDEKFSGLVKQVRKASTMDQGVVKYQVVISAHNPALKLMPGMTANVIITSETRDDCLKVPNGAIRFRPDSVANFPYPPEAGKNGKIKDRKNGVGKKGKGRGIHEKSVDEAERYSTVWVFESQDKVRDKVRSEKILPGITDGRYTEMKRGSLKEGDLIITGVEVGKGKKPSITTSGAPGRPSGGGPGGPGGRGMRI
jgi:HlyD family secretion protein